MILEGRRVLYVDTQGALDTRQVAMVAPNLSQYVLTWSTFDNVLEAISTYGSDHIVMDDLAAFDMYLGNEGFKSNFSALLKRLAEMGVSVDVINQIRSKPGVDHVIPYYEDYVTTHFRNNVEIRRVEGAQNGMVYQMVNQSTRLYVEVFIDNMGLLDEAYTIAALLKEPLTDNLRELIKDNRQEIFTRLITRYGFEVPQAWI